ncbi:MAG: nucleotidyltransferase domain-containing protein [Theionarchaea archaeon]|nr:nucleotidyltransferase domain-containing protein [Theionarchaea archaeon]
MMKPIHEEQEILQKIALRSICNKNLRLFFSSLLENLCKRYGEKIKSVVLFGSSTTDSWINGRSDVDFVIVVENRDTISKVTGYTNDLILSLNEKYNLNLDETCSTYAKGKNSLIRVIQKIESFFTFGAPFIVFSLDEIDFESNKTKNFRIHLITSLFDSLDIFIYKAKKQGLVLYGIDYLSEFECQRSFLSKLQTMVAPIWILLVAFLTVGIDRQFSLKHANKATLWATEDILFALDLEIYHMAANFRKINELFSSVFIKSHLDKTLAIRTLEDTSELEDCGFSYIWDTFRFICFCYPKVVSSVIKKHLSAKGEDKQ